MINVFRPDSWADRGITIQKLYGQIASKDAEIERLKKELDYQAKIGAQQFEQQRVEIECLRSKLNGFKNFERMKNEC